MSCETLPVSRSAVAEAYTAASDRSTVRTIKATRKGKGLVGYRLFTHRQRGASVILAGILLGGCTSKTKRGTPMKLRTVISAAALALMLSAATVGVANAGQPTNPGCFGTDRAAYFQSHDPAETAQILAGRAGDNGSINRDYAAGCGGQPTH